MKSSKKVAHDITFSEGVHLATYVSDWKENVNIELREEDESGVTNTYDIWLPITLGRKLVESLANDIIKYDEKMAEKAAEKAAEAA
tara:strand:- start:44 stop:301 length:258 start_codon:yes stop_codon:yes gene_type:complete